MVLSTEWSQVEIIDLINDGSGLGFGIVGGRSTGVVVKSILPGGIADRDGRLQSGDHILQINDVYTTGFASENVATLLRQSAAQVHLIVARSVDSTSCDYRTVNSHAPIVPTKVISNPDELNALLLQNGYVESDTPTPTDEKLIPISIEIDGSSDSNPIYKVPSCGSLAPVEESETIRVTLEKNEYGLGITVAGYVWEREDLSGIFVKSISKGSAADLNHEIAINDRIVEVNGTNLRDRTNHEAVEILKASGARIHLTLERYLKGPRYDHLQNAISQTYEPKRVTSPPSPSVTTLSWIPAQTNPINQSTETIDSNVLETDLKPDPETVELFVDDHFESGSVTPDADAAIKRKWQAIIGADAEIIVTQLRKLRGLGISLEGTVDVEDGVELRPRHFIRSILREGPVGKDGALNSGDELLEVNGQRLVGNSHVEVVKILRELPETVRIVCARSKVDDRVIDPRPEAFDQRNLLGNVGSLIGRLSPKIDESNPMEKECVRLEMDGPSNLQMELQTSTSSTATLAEDMEPIDNSKLDPIVLVHSEDTADDGDVFEDPEENGRDLTVKNGQIEALEGFETEKTTTVRDTGHERHEEAFKDDPDLNDSIFEDNSVNRALSPLIDEGISLSNNRIDDEKINDSIAPLKSPETPEDDRREAAKMTSLIKFNGFYRHVTDVDLFMNNATDHVKFRRQKQKSEKDAGSRAIRHTKETFKRKSRSLDNVTYLATWMDDVEFVELEKTAEGLGFAILDYQDPVNPGRMVIVVRTLTANGAAERSGKLMPGDRLMSVNGRSLRNVTLDEAVKELKGAPYGKVVLGFSKPAPLFSDSENDSPKNSYFIW